MSRPLRLFMENNIAYSFGIFKYHFYDFYKLRTSKPGAGWN